MKKILIALVFALMSIVANGQIEHKTEKIGRFVSHYYEIKIGDYVFKTYPGKEKTTFVKESFYIEKMGLELSEPQKVCEYIDKNKAAIEKKYGIMIDVCIGYHKYNSKYYKYYTGTLLISMPQDYEEYELAQKHEREKREKELNSRLSSLNSVL